VGDDGGYGYAPPLLPGLSPLLFLLNFLLFLLVLLPVDAASISAAGRHHLDCQLSPQNCRLKIERAKRRTHLRPPFLHASVIQ
jgi:hypothetical protein